MTTTEKAAYADRQKEWERVQALLAPHIPLSVERSQLIDHILDAAARAEVIE